MAIKLYFWFSKSFYFAGRRLPGVSRALDSALRNHNFAHKKDQDTFWVFIVATEEMQKPLLSSNSKHCARRCKAD